VQGGTLELQKGLDGILLRVESGGTVRGRGTLRASVQNDGHFVVSGASGQGFSIDGHYDQGIGGWLDFFVGHPLQISGSAGLNGTLNVLGVRDGYTSQARETILGADGGVS